VIRAYPRELEQVVTLADGRELLLRPIRAEDEPALIRGFQRLSPEEIRLRFHHPIKMLVHKLAARLTQIDYDREMALILVDTGEATDMDIHGVIRLSEDPDRQRAEFAIIVGHWMTGRGIGTMLLGRLIDYARDRGIGELFGSVLAENQRMLDLCRRLGFTLETDRSEPGIVLVRLRFSSCKQHHS
jgi:acetyltransferase